MDFIDLPPVLSYSHCLGIVYMFSGWTECYPIRHADATTVAKKLILEIIPQFGILLWVKSDQVIHFTAEINNLLAKTLGYSLKFHTLYHSQSLGQVECKSPHIKRTLGEKIC